MHHHTGLSYDPWRHAAQLRVDVLEHPLPPGHRGHYYHRERLIVVSPRLTARQARVTLTHEVMHAVRGDRWTPNELATACTERVVNTLTALQLVTVVDYARAETIHGPHDAAIAHELEVTRDVVVLWRAVVLNEIQQAA